MFLETLARAGKMIQVWEVIRSGLPEAGVRWDQCAPAPAPGPFSLWNPPHAGANCLLWAALGESPLRPETLQAWEALFREVRRACGLPEGAHLDAVEGLGALQDALRAQGQPAPSFEVWKLQETEETHQDIAYILRLVGDGPPRIVAHRGEAFLGVHAPRQDTGGGLDTE